MNAAIDLDRYLERIGWGGATSPAFDTMAGMLRAHMRAIPFENLDVLLGRPISLDIDRVERKLVDARRGGYCFEHATLFAAALDALGFEVLRHSARVVLFTPPAHAPRTHMFLTVRLPDGDFVLDPGFGGPASTVPVPLHLNRPDASATHWMARDGAYWSLRTRRDGAVRDAWVTTLEHDHPIDFVMASHFVATHPTSLFRERLMMSIFTPAGRVGVMNRDVTIEDGAHASARIADRVALRAFVDENFGFDLPEIKRLRVPAIPEWA